MSPNIRLILIAAVFSMAGVASAMAQTPALAAPAVSALPPLLATVPPALPAPAASPVAAAAQPPIDNAVDIAKPADSPPPVSRVKSLFFTQEEMAQIYKSLDNYKKLLESQKNGNEGEDFLKQLEGKAGITNTSKQPKPKFYTYPQFFLASLIYHAPGDWSIELNGQKYSPSQKPPKAEIEVQTIDKDRVSLIWRPSANVMERINKKWNAEDNKSVLVDSLAGTVAFSLHTNQTFSSFQMRVIEGKVMPVTEAIAPESGSSDSLAKPSDSTRLP